MAKTAARSASNDTPPASGHNLSPDQRHALVLLHRRRFKEIDAREKLVKAEKRNLGKVIKADLGDYGLDQIKTLIRMETPEGEAAVTAEIAALRQAASWAVGEDGQLEMFADKKPVGETKAFMDGKLAGMDDLALNNPFGAGTSDAEDYARGWQRGRAVMEELLATRAQAEAELIEGPGHDEGGDLDEGEDA